MTVQTKPAWQSMTLWGGLIALIPPVAKIIGYDIAPEDMANLEGAVEAIISGIGAIMVFVGRYRAKTKIGKPT